MCMHMTADVSYIYVSIICIYIYIYIYLFVYLFIYLFGYIYIYIYIYIFFYARIAPYALEALLGQEGLESLRACLG